MASSFISIEGGEGAGKSTQVFGWQRRVPGPYRYVPPQPYPSRWERPPVDDLVCADEISRMPEPIPANQCRRALPTLNKSLKPWVSNAS